MPAIARQATGDILVQDNVLFQTVHRVEAGCAFLVRKDKG